MNQLIKVDYNNERPTVSGRELHELLEVKEKYTQWFLRMCEYGFSEKIDFTGLSVISEKPQGGRPSQDHELTIDMAKELCMLQRSEKGKQARQYFIQLEKDWNSPEKIMARALQIADRKIHILSAQIEKDRPKVLFADAVETSHASILIGDLAKLLKQNSMDIGQNRLFERLRKEGYLCSRNGDQYNSPTQRSMDMKLFEVRKRTITNPDGSIRITHTTKVTGKGQIYFINKYCGKRERPMLGTSASA